MNKPAIAALREVVFANRLYPLSRDDFLKHLDYQIGATLLSQPCHCVKKALSFRSEASPPTIAYGLELA